MFTLRVKSAVSLFEDNSDEVHEARNIGGTLRQDDNTISLPVSYFTVGLLVHEAICSSYDEQTISTPKLRERY